MADKSLASDTKDVQSDRTLFEDLNARFLQSKAFVNKKKKLWEENERLFNAERVDSANDTGLITDGSLATLIIERAARVTAQLQTGRVKEIGATPSAAAQVVDLLYKEDIVPNTNSNGSMQTKLFQTQVSDGLYGTVAAMYGLNVTDKNAYADFWILKPQNYYPQPGKVTPHDMQWAQVETEVTVGQLKAILDYEGTSWDKKAVQKVIDEAKEGAAKKDSNDVDTASQRDNYSQSEVRGKGDYAPIRLRTEYQSGENGMWITYAPDYDGAVLRKTPNRHKNCKIPIVQYTSIPLLDELYGMSTMDRGKSIQKTIDSFTNLGYQNALLNVLPPMKVDTSKVISSTIELKPGATWRMTDLNAIQPFTTGNLAQDYFQSAISSMRSILLNQNGTTDTMQNAESSNDPTFGKTKSAIDMRTQKQNARDSLNVRRFDEFYSELANGLIDVKLNCATKPVQINLEQEEINNLLEDPEMEKYINVKGNMVEIKLGELKKGNFKYVVDPGTSVEADDATEHSRWNEILSTIGTNPALIQMAQQEGYEVSLGAALKKFIATSGTKDYEEVIRKKTDEELQAEQQEAMQAQMQGQPAPQEGAEPQAQEQAELHPFVNHLMQNPEEAMSHAAQGGY